MAAVPPVLISQKAGIDGDRQQRRADGIDLGPAPAVGEMAEERDEEDHDQGRDRDGPERRGARHFHIVHEISDAEDGEDVEEHPVDEARAHAEENAPGY